MKHISHTELIHNHMTIPWHHLCQEEHPPISKASLSEKASVIGRTGLMLLSCGTGAWRVRSSMNTLARTMGITCTADVGLVSIEYTCIDKQETFSQTLCLTTTGVNTAKLSELENFVLAFPSKYALETSEHIHKFLDHIEHRPGHYTPPCLGLAAAVACSAFTFLLGGGPLEMLCAFLGAGIGNWLRAALTKKGFTLLLCVACSVALACLGYTASLKALEYFFAVSQIHQAGYICSMLFIIPGFPFITSGIDLAKLDMRSGLERLSYSLMIVIVAALVAWGMALLLHLEPSDFAPLGLSDLSMFLLRLIASFCGVFGFSIMFNSPIPLAVAAASIGAIANTLRLELVDLVNAPPAAAAFIGALTAGILASLMKDRVGYPRISVTVPSIVIMVPGLYLYRGFYNLGIMSLATSATWFASALLIILALPLGLIFARILTDKTFRYCT